MRRLMELVRAKRIDLTPMLTHELALKDIAEAYAIFGERKQGVIKIAIRP
jgi:threonine dehydrogenase-like Zn-dependent dehydrogenase